MAIINLSNINVDIQDFSKMFHLLEDQGISTEGIVVVDNILSVPNVLQGQLDAAFNDYILIHDLYVLTTTKNNAYFIFRNYVIIARQKYITTLTGQDDVYREKISEAIAHASANYPADLTNYPFINAEVQATGSTPQQASDSIIAARTIWTTKMAAIEQIRRKFKIDIDNATTIEEVETIKTNAITALQAV